MKAVLALFLLCAAMSAAGREHPRPSPNEPVDSIDADEVSPAHGPVVVRATQVNRCPDARGKIVLQDLPCGPEVARSASAPEAAADIVDLAHLEKRPQPEPSLRAPRDPENRFTQGLVSGAWKMGLLLAVFYGAWWAFSALRGHFRYRRLQAEIAADSARYSRTPVRPSRR